MPNTVQAAAEGMPSLTRRTALAMSSAGILSAITVLSSAKAAPAASGIAARVEECRNLKIVRDAAWEKLDLLREAYPLPLPKVRVAWRRVGFDDATREPIYCDSVREIEAFCGRDAAISRNIYGPNPSAIQRIEGRYRERVDTLAADLRAQEEAVERQERDTGIAAAEQAATAASQAFYEALDALVADPGDMLADTSQVAQFLVEWMADTGDDAEPLLTDFVRAVAGKAVRS